VSQAVPGELNGWRSRTTFVLALSASAVGLGNLWRFSYLTGENGGGPFVVTYVLCLFLVAVPLMVGEVVIGSHGKGGPVAALRRVADRSLLSRGWSVLGWLACATGMLILAYYVVVAGWGLAYARFMQSGVFSAASAPVVGEYFGDFLAEPARQAYWQTLFLLLAGGFVLFGVRRGLGLMVWLAVPCLLALLGALLKYSFDNGDLVAAREFLFSVKWIDFSPRSILVALGHAFFTLGVGVGTGISYGAYARLDDCPAGGPGHFPPGVRQQYGARHGAGPAICQRALCLRQPAAGGMVRRTVFPVDGGGRPRICGGTGGPNPDAAGATATGHRRAGGGLHRVDSGPGGGAGHGPSPS
jgi:NSS family neurotransmitter:Na+ symporter